jgi:drug/metabolite transporter (DMT)-like permease
MRSFGLDMRPLAMASICCSPPLKVSAFSKPITAAIYVGFFELGITYTFWLKALQLSETTGKISNFIYLTPFVSLIFIHSVLHERLYYTSVIGLCLIIGGILVGQIKKSSWVKLGKLKI